MKPRQPSRRNAGNGGNSNRLQTNAWEMRWSSAPDETSAAAPRRRSSIDAGRCPEVQGVRDRPTRSRRATSASAASARSRSPTTPRRRRRRTRCAAASRPARSTIWRYADFLPLRRRPPRARPLPTGCDAAGARRPARRAPRPRARCGSRTSRQPDALVQGPRRLGRARRAHASSASTTLACASTGNLANAVAAHAAAAGPASPTSSSRPTSRSRRSSRPASTARTLVAVRGNYDDVNRLCTELSGERDGWAFVNVNMRPYYAEGSKTLAYEIAEQLGWELPDRDRRADRLRLAVHEDRHAASRSGSSSGCSTASVPTMNGAQAEGCSPVAQAFAAGHDVCRPVKPDTIAKSLAIGNPADGPYALELAPHDRRRDRRGHRRRDPRRHPPARRDDRHLHRDRRRRDHRDAGQARRARRHRPRRARRARHHRRRPEDARRGARHVRGAPRSTPSLDAFEAALSRGGGGLMAVTVKLPTQLRAAAGGAAEAEVDGATVGEVLEALYDRSTASCASGSPTTTAACAASSTSTSAARTSASSTGSTRRSPTATR